jgi:uncharacterized membrane protein
MFAETLTDMNTLLIVFLVIHIAAGFSALITGTFAIAVRKGSRTHNRAGRIFFYLMLVVTASAVVLSIFRPNVFLLLIAFFGFYQNLNGYRAIRNKSLRPARIDWIVSAIGLVTGILMIAQLDIVLIVFGSLSLLLSIGDFRSHYLLSRGGEAGRTAWLARHIGMMMGAYIATFTAFVVVNVQFEPMPWLPWLAPTAMFVPLMAYYQKKFAGRESRISRPLASSSRQSADH